MILIQFSNFFVKWLTFCLLGNYTCIADNGVGKAKERVMTLQVGFPPSIEMGTPKAPQALYYEAEMKCNIKAYPSPTIQWVKKGENIHNGYNFKISHFAHKDDYVTSTLKVRKCSQFGN